MILSNKTIREYLSNGKIQIYPEFHEKDIRPVGIRLHLGSEILLPFEGQTVDLSSKEEVFFEKIDLLQNRFVLQPGQFILASTYEKFQVPRNIVCHVDGRSTVARIGVTIHCTSAIIDGNFEEARSIVLEMKNQGPFSIILHHKIAVAMLSFIQLSTEIEQSAQKQYLNQTGVMAPNLQQQKE